jgi:hypothetical protein
MALSAQSYSSLQSEILAQFGEQHPLAFMAGPRYAWPPNDAGKG